MEEMAQQEAKPRKEPSRPRFRLHLALAKQDFQPLDPKQEAELLQKREEKLRQRLDRALKKHFSASQIPGALAKIESQVQAGASLEERVWVLESIPAGVRSLDRQVRQAIAQVQPIVEAAAQFSRLVPQLQNAIEQVQSAHSCCYETPVPRVEQIVTKNLKAASLDFAGTDAVSAAMEQLRGMEQVQSIAKGDLEMSRSILDDLCNPHYGYGNAVGEIERALGSRRELEKVMGLDREVERVMSQGEIYKRALGLNSSHVNAIQAMSPTRDLVERALRPFPDLDGLLALSGRERASAFTSYGKINRSIANAPVLGKAKVQEKDAAQSQNGDPEKESNPEFESKLVKTVPAAVLTQIRVPLNELNRVLRHPQAMRSLGSREFEQFIATLIEQLGFDDVVLTPPSGDQGRDVLATKRVAGIPIFFAFECKRYAPDRPVGPEIARALLGTIMHGPTRASMGVLVTTSTFTPAAREFILTSPVLDGKDFDGVLEWLKEYSALGRARNVG